jgi:hypothetical protein
MDYETIPNILLQGLTSLRVASIVLFLEIQLRASLMQIILSSPQIRQSSGVSLHC